jgi:hypothetical protein
MLSVVINYLFFVVDWINGDSSKVTLSLLNGPTPQTESVISVIASNVNGDDGSYTWTVSSPFLTSTPPY